MAIRLTLQADSNVFYVEQEQKTTLLDFLSKLAALTSAIYGICAVVMTAMEWWFAKIADTTQKRREIAMQNSAKELVDKVL